MALRCLKLTEILRSVQIFRHNWYSTVLPITEQEKINKGKEYRTENDIIYYEDPDTFGTLSKALNRDKVVLEDLDDIKEEKYITEKPLPSQKLTIKQYADIIKQYIKYRRFKEALNVLEIKMIKEDNVKPVNYIYNILIGACADVGYTKKAFKLFNDMKRRALKPTGDTYTCLFQACCNSPWPVDGLKNAKHLRELMLEKSIEPNLTNYNAMIKAFGRCGDLQTAFQIVDEMLSKKIKIRVHTFNHLLQACISDKENGLRHALLVWRKMLNMREKPNIYSFNLMLKCVKECNLGTKEDIVEMLSILQQQALLSDNKKTLQIAMEKPLLLSDSQQHNNSERLHENNVKPISKDSITVKDTNNLTLFENNNKSLDFVSKLPKRETRDVPNLLSKTLNMNQVMSLQEVTTVQEKFAVIGGQEDFLKEMREYSIKPDIKTFTQMLLLLDETTEEENKLLETMKTMNVFADIDFYNMLIKKRCLRLDYDAAIEVKELIEKESKWRKKKYPLKKKLRLNPNIMTYGVMAMACKTKDNAEKLLNEMKEAHLKVNAEILGTLLRQGTANSNFDYVLYIMQVVKDENIQINDVFLKHLKNFDEKCQNIAKIEKQKSTSSDFIKDYKGFSKVFVNWLREINIDEVLKPEHPWEQFNKTYPETVQRQNITIEMPKKFYKRNRKYVRYAPPI